MIVLFQGKASERELGLPMSAISEPLHLAGGVLARYAVNSMLEVPEDDHSFRPDALLNFMRQPGEYPIRKETCDVSLLVSHS